MKTATHIIHSLIVSFIILAGTSTAQDQIAVPLTNPGQPGKLNLNLITGSIKVTGYEGNEVVIRYTDLGGGITSRDDSDREENRDGLRRISRGAPGFEINENNNTVTISGIIPVKPVDFEILVPSRFSLNLASVKGEYLTVENVNGDHEISHVNGDIELRDVSGSALVNTVNGNIIATFSGVSPDKPMAFGNLNGRIDVTLPAHSRFSAKMRSELGEMFTDFEFSAQESGIRQVQTSNSRFSVEVNNWVTADVNGGGPEYLFRTLRGNIYLRSR